MTVRLAVYHRAPQEEPGAVEEAYRRFLPDFQGTPGVLDVRLLRSAMRW